MPESSPVASALGLVDGAIPKYLRSISRVASLPGALRLFSHTTKNQFALHGPCITLAAALRVEDPRAPETLPGPDGPVDTLMVSPRAARDMAAAALFSAGKKVMLINVSKEGVCSVVAKASPGSLDEIEKWMDLDVAVDNLPERPLMDGGTVVAVRVFGKGKSGATGNVGVAAWDAGRKRMSLMELHDDDVFSGLESLLVAVNAMEVLVCDGDLGKFETDKMGAMLEECGIACTFLEKKRFADGDVDVDLERLVGSALPLVKFLDMKRALPAAAAVIGFLRLMEDPTNEGASVVTSIDHNAFMHLDTAALRALNVVPFTGDGGGGKRATLFGLLNRTKTPMGSRLLRHWIAQPLQDREAINTRLDVTEAFMEGREACLAVRNEHLHRLPDLAALIGRFTKNNGAKASLQDVVRLYQSSIRLPYLAGAIDESASSVLKKLFVEPLGLLTEELGNFEALVETTIDLDQIANGEFVISPKIDVQLAELRESQDSLIADIADEHRKVLREVRPPKDEALKLEKHDVYGYVFRVTRKDEKLIRDRSGYTVVDTRKDGVRFQSRNLKALASNYVDVARDYKDVEGELRAKTIEVASTYMETFSKYTALAAEIDVLAAFSDAAGGCAGDSYIRPTITPAGSGLVLKQARHPMVEECLDGRSFIANDINLGSNDASPADGGRAASDDAAAMEKGSGALLLITGPNTGGKSTYIRTAGVLTLMAHIGCFVPAAEASIPITDRILCRVGAGDNQHRAVSTFMSEMLETATILRSATKNSLIIIDELGRGTGVSDGYGLAYAISHHIATEIRAPTLFATHFHELTALAAEVPSVRNLSVTALTDKSAEGITFLYEVKEGACGKSFGVHVAEMARFPAPVVRAAKRKLADLEGADGISSLVQKRTKALSGGDVSKGQALMDSFLADVLKLPLGTEHEQKKSIEAANGLKQTLLSKNNPYILALLSDE